MREFSKIDLLIFPHQIDSIGQITFICVAVMNRFGEGDGEEVIKV